MRVFFLLSMVTLGGCATGATQQQLRDRAAFDLNCPSKEVSVVDIDARTRGVTGCDRRLTYVEQCRPCANGHVSCDCTWILNAQSQDKKSAAAKPFSQRPESVPVRETTVLLAWPSQYKTPLFEHEVAPLHRAAARFLEAKNPRWKVVPWSDLVALREAAQQRHHPSSKLSCKNTPAPFELVSWKYKDAHRAHLNLNCNEGCTLTLNVQSPKTNKRSVNEGRWSTSLAPKATPADWVAAVARLQAIPAPAGGALLGSLAMGTKDKDAARPKVEVKEVWAYGDWSPTPRLDQKRLDACWALGQYSAGSERFNLELNELGTPLRCEQTHSFSKQADDSPACMCSALRASNFGRGSAGRRLQVQLMQRLSPRPVIDGRKVYVSSEGWLSHDPFAAARGLSSRYKEVESCFVASASERIMKLPLRWMVAPDGSTASFGLGESPSPVSNEQAACVRAALSQAEFPCPLDSKAVEVQAQLVVRYAPAP